MWADGKVKYGGKEFWESVEIGSLTWRCLFTFDGTADDCFVTLPGNGITWSQSRELLKVPWECTEECWGEDSVGKVMAEKYEDLKSDPQISREKPGLVECICNVSTGEAETSSSQALSRS